MSNKYSWLLARTHNGNDCRDKTYKQGQLDCSCQNCTEIDIYLENKILVKYWTRQCVYTICMCFYSIIFRLEPNDISVGRLQLSVSADIQKNAFKEDNIEKGAQSHL